MASKKVAALGTTFVFDGLTIGEVMDAAPSPRTCNVQPILTVDSTQGFIEKIAGALDEGEVTLHIVYDGSAAGVYNTLNTKYQERTEGTLLITFKDTSFYSCTAIISSLDKPGFGAADAFVEGNVTLSISGKATFEDVAG
ncbi:hypothetical protein ES703_21005 [subsurface metagenome]